MQMQTMRLLQFLEAILPTRLLLGKAVLVLGAYRGCFRAQHHQKRLAQLRVRLIAQSSSQRRPWKASCGGDCLCLTTGRLLSLPNSSRTGVLLRKRRSSSRSTPHPPGLDVGENTGVWSSVANVAILLGVTTGTTC